jgi:hypothetical protein
MLTTPKGWKLIEAVDVGTGDELWDGIEVGLAVAVAVGSCVGIKGGGTTHAEANTFIRTRMIAYFITPAFRWEYRLLQALYFTNGMFVIKLNPPFL